MPPATSARTPRSYRSRLPTIRPRRRGGRAATSRCAADPSTSSTRHSTCATAAARADGERPRLAARRSQRVEEAIERAILAEEQQLVLPAEVVIEVAGRQI